MTEPEARPDRAEGPDEPPPFLGAWSRLYLGVIGWLALLILVSYCFTRGFAP